MNHNEKKKENNNKKRRKKERKVFFLKRSEVTEVKKKAKTNFVAVSFRRIMFDLSLLLFVCSFVLGRN